MLSGAAKLPTLKVDPPTGQFVPQGFTLTADCTSNDSATVTEVDVFVDGNQVNALKTPPFSQKIPPSLQMGAHQIYVLCQMSTLATARADILNVIQVAGCRTGRRLRDQRPLLRRRVRPRRARAQRPRRDVRRRLQVHHRDLRRLGLGRRGHQRVCALDCDANNACPSGFACEGSDASSQLCLPHSSGGGCNAGGGVPLVPLALGACVLGAILLPRRRSGS